MTRGARNDTIEKRMELVFDPVTLTAILILAWSERRFHGSFKTIEKPRPSPRSVPRLDSYRFISPLKEIEKAREKAEMLPHPIE